jgi:hypothetical protein
MSKKYNNNHTAKTNAVMRTTTTTRKKNAQQLLPPGTILDAEKKMSKAKYTPLKVYFKIYDLICVCININIYTYKWFFREILCTVF